MMTEEQVMALVERLRPLLAGYPPEAQGAALADLLATWLASHVWQDGDVINRRVTEDKRDELLTMHIAMVRQMLPLEHARIHGGAIGHG